MTSGRRRPPTGVATFAPPRHNPHAKPIGPRQRSRIDVTPPRQEASPDVSLRLKATPQPHEVGAHGMDGWMPFALLD